MYRVGWPQQQQQQQQVVVHTTVLRASDISISMSSADEQRQQRQRQQQQQRGVADSSRTGDDAGHGCIHNNNMFNGTAEAISITDSNNHATMEAMHQQRHPHHQQHQHAEPQYHQQQQPEQLDAGGSFVTDPEPSANDVTSKKRSVADLLLGPQHYSENGVASHLTSSAMNRDDHPLYHPPNNSNKRVKISESAPTVFTSAAQVELSEEVRAEAWWSATEYTTAKKTMKDQCRTHRKTRRYSDCLSKAYQTACQLAAATRNNNDTSTAAASITSSPAAGAGSSDRPSDGSDTEALAAAVAWAESAATARTDGGEEEAVQKEDPVAAKAAADHLQSDNEAVTAGAAATIVSMDRMDGIAPRSLENGGPTAAALEGEEGEFRDLLAAASEGPSSSLSSLPDSDGKKPSSSEQQEAPLDAPDQGLLRWHQDEGPRGLEGYSSRLHAMRRQRHLHDQKHAVFLEQARQNIRGMRDAETLAKQAEMASLRARTFATLLGQADAWVAQNPTEEKEEDEEASSAEETSPPSNNISDATIQRLDNNAEQQQQQQQQQQQPQQQQQNQQPIRLDIDACVHQGTVGDHNGWPIVSPDDRTTDGGGSGEVTRGPDASPPGENGA